MKTTPSQLRLLADEDLDREFAAVDHDEATKAAILYEKVRRLSRPSGGRPWIQWTLLVVSLLTLAFAAVAAWPVIAGFGEKEWFDF